MLYFAYMCKEESPARVVRVRVRLAVLVVHPVVAHPHVDGVLGRDAVGQHEEEAERGPSLEGAVRPQAVGARGDALTKGNVN